jgi:tripartite-type tricarboxylate transporter receptor subunit TctC
MKKDMSADLIQRRDTQRRFSRNEVGPVVPTCRDVAAGPGRKPVPSRLALLGTRLAVFVALASGLASLSAARAEDFYAGKSIRLMINFVAGGAADLEARVFARHVTRHIKGEPKVTPNNMEGAGGMAAVNYLVRDSIRDGLGVGYITGYGARAAFAPDTFRADPRTFEMIALNPGAAIYFARADIPPGLKTPADLMQARNIFAGGISAFASKDVTARLTLDMLGLPHGYLPGYAGTTAVRMALEKGEVNFYSENRPAYQSIIAPLVSAGAVLPLWYDPGVKGDELVIVKSVADLPIKPFHEFHKDVKGAYPSGKHWDAYRAMLAVNASLLRTIVLPPGSPREAVDALRAAVASLNDDKAFIEDATRVLGFAPHYETGARLNEQVRDMLRITPENKQFIEEYIARGGGR